MPRDGSQVYHRPPGIDAVSNMTISSTAYNLNVQDVETDLNTPRPVVAGGTGASTAAGAMANLKGELSGQVVTNYDSATIQAGSFYSAPGATGAPTSTHSFSGIAYAIDANNMTLEARDATTGLRWTRVKTAGVWAAWTQNQGNQFVLKAGDTMTGSLVIAPTSGSAGLTLNKPASGQQNLLYGLMNGSARWIAMFGDSAAEGGGATGSNFGLYRAGDTGTLIDAPLSILRSSGDATFTHNVTVNGNVTSGAASTSGVYYFGNSGSKYLICDGTNYGFAGGTVTANQYTCTTLAVTSNTTVGGGMQITGNCTASTYFTTSGTGVIVGGFSGTNPYLTEIARGNANYGPMSIYAIYVAGSWAGIEFNINNLASFDFRHDGQAYKAGGGSWANISDARIKDVVGDYQHGLTEVLQLQPKIYTYKANASYGPPGEEQRILNKQEAETKREFIGLIAQDAEGPMPELVSQGTAYIDGVQVTDFRNMDTSPLVFALINAVKTLAARVEALEAK